MMVDEATLREAALELLASSTARRYMREARRLAGESGLVDALRSDPQKRTAARDRVAELLAVLAAEGQRSAAELELAIVLCALARSDALGSMDLLRRATNSSSAWIRGLGQRLLAWSPASAEELAELEARLAAVLEGAVVIAESLEVSDREDPSVFPRAA